MQDYKQFKDDGEGSHLLTYQQDEYLKLDDLKEKENASRRTYNAVRICVFLVLFPVGIYCIYAFFFAKTFPYRMENFDKMSDAERVNLFHQFKNVFNKDYTKEEHSTHLPIFLENCHKIHKHNKDHEIHGYRLAMNDFGDLSSEQFHSLYANGLAEEPEEEMEVAVGSPASQDYSELPDVLDWRVGNYITPAQSQSSCGACYIFSTLAAIESRCAIKGWPLLQLSVKEVLDCISDQSCVRGFQSHVYKWGAPENENGYSKIENYKTYNAMIEKCEENPKEKHIMTLQKYGKIYVSGTQDLEGEVKRQLQNGPMSTAICTTAVDWQFLDDGVVRGRSCDGLTHGVTLIGYGHDEKSNLDYWIIKNSWGPSWGRDGFAYLCRGENCGNGRPVGRYGFAAVLKQIFYPVCTEWDGTTTGNEMSTGGNKKKNFLEDTFEKASEAFVGFFNMKD